jgi:Tol biopolymer transport system component
MKPLKQIFYRMRLGSALIVSMIFVLIFSVLVTSQSTIANTNVPPALSGKIAYHSYSDYSNWDGKIYLLDLSQRSCQYISDGWNVDHAINPQFSPDGTKLIFQAVPKGDHNYNSLEIYLWDIGTQNPTRLTNNNLPDEDPKFSPNGQLIVFKREGYIYLMKPEPESVTNIPTRTTANAFEESMPFYTKDGAFKILYSSGIDQNADIRMVNENGSEDNFVNGAHQSDTLEYYPIGWYDDKFLYTRWYVPWYGSGDQPADQIYVCDINSGQTESLMINNGYESENNSDAYPIDRKYILFSSTRAGMGSYDLFIGDVETGNFWSISQFGGINTANAELGATYCPTSNFSEFYDNFSYDSNNNSQLSSFQWYIRNDQEGPDFEDSQWSRDNIQFVADSESSNNRFLRLVSKTSGTYQSCTNAEIGQENNRFYEGTYGARVFLTDSPKLWQDQTVQGVFTINGLPHNDPNYGECDFEYLAYDRWWGVGITPAMYFTTWEVVPDPLPWDSTYKRTDWLQRSLAGWHTLLIQIGNGTVNYLIDGILYASHGGDYYPEQPMRIYFEHCFNKYLNYLNSSSVERTYIMDVDWLYHAKNAILTTPEVQSLVDNYMSRGLVRLDTMPLSTSPILSVNLNEINVNSFLGKGSINVDNIGNGIMLWSASVAFGNSWLIITSGASGTNSGTVNFSCMRNESDIPRMGAIRITTEGATGSPQYITVVQQGTPTTPAISMTPASRDFGSVQVGSYADLTFTVQNTGGGTLSGNASVPAPFSIVSGSPYSLTAGQCQVVTVRFSPTPAQAYSQNVTFTGGGGATRPVSGISKVATPVISPESGTFNNSQQVIPYCSTLGATIRYTTDGTTPTSSSALYTNPFTVSLSCTVKAKGFKTGCADSDIASAYFMIKKVATPVICPNGGTFSSPQQVILPCSTTDANIYYTTDGDDPTSSSTKYANPFTVASSCTVKARAFKNGYTDSYVATANFVIKVATPTISPNGSTFSSAQQVILSCSPYDATIRYTTDGNDPTSSSVLYTNPFTVNSSCTVKARGFKTGYADSKVASAVFVIGPVISGYVKSSGGTPLAGVTIITIPDAGTTTTNTSGYYALRVPPNWSGKIEPKKTNYTFVPASRTYTNVTSSKSSQNCTGYVNLTISGYVKTSGGTAISGVTITASNSGGTTTTSSTGYYALRVPYNWSGKITPTKTGYSFVPSSRSYTAVTASKSSQNYTAYVRPTISGYVKTSGGTAISGVTITASNSGGTTTTNSTGYYALRVPYNWTGSIMPTKTGYSFVPSSRPYTAVTTSKSLQNYTAYVRPTISGYVKTSGGTAISGVTITASNSGGTTTTSSTGYYALRVPYNWTGSVTPTKTGYSFVPSSRPYTAPVTASKSSQNYTGS